MKITIQHYDETASIDVPDGADLDHFQETITRLLRFIWLPEQVDEIMRVKDYDDGYKAGLAAEISYDEGHAKGYEEAVDEMRKTYEPMLEETANDSKRLDWLLNEYKIRWDMFNDRRVTRGGIDKEMTESKHKNTEGNNG